MGLTINKKIYFYIILVVFFFTKSSFIFAQSFKIAKIDLSLALILHPKMSLFDYDKLGFYRIPIVLSENDFYEKKSKIVVDYSNKKNKIISLRQQINELNKALKNDNSLNRNKESTIKEFEFRFQNIKEELEQLEFEYNNSEITDLIETRIILSEINKEVLEIIKEIALEQNFNVVINNSTFTNEFYPSAFNNRNAFKNINVAINENSYYYFLSEALFSDENNPPSSLYLSNWLESAKYPELIDALPLKSQYLVVDGAKDILLEVIKRIYSKYQIPSEVRERIIKNLSNIHN